MIKTEQWTMFFQSLEAGLNIVDSSVNAGISRFSVHKHVNEDPEFAEHVERSLLQSKIRAIGIVQKAALTQWQAAAWWLERKHHLEFALHTKQEVSGYLEHKESDAEDRERRARVQKRIDEMLGKI